MSACLRKEENIKLAILVYPVPEDEGRYQRLSNVNDTIKVRTIINDQAEIMQGGLNHGERERNMNKSVSTST